MQSDSSSRAKPKPRIFKLGAVSVQIYTLGDGRFAVADRLGGGKRKVVTRTTEKAIDAEAGRICRAILNGRIKADALSADERSQAVIARDLLAPRGLSLDAAARDLAAALDVCGGASLMEMARFWAKHHAHASGPVPALPEIHARLIESIADQDLAPRWRQAIKSDLKKFVQGFAGQPVGEILDDDIQGWLRVQPGNWRTRNNRLALIKQFFHFARRKGFLPQDRDTEADKVSPLKRPRGEHSRPGVLSAGELGDVLAAVGPAWLPFVALGAFAGMRRAEIERLDWSDVRWEERLIHVRQEVAKSTRRKAGDERFIPMRDQLLAWLQSWRGRTGPVCTRKRFEDELERLRKPAKDEKGKVIRAAVVRGEWPKNALRHTYGSCRMGETRNMPQVADEMGNSVSEVRRDYRNPRTDREVAAWAALRPEGAPDGIVIQFNGTQG